MKICELEECENEVPPYKFGDDELKRFCCANHRVTAYNRSNKDRVTVSPGKPCSDLIDEKYPDMDTEAQERANKVLHCLTFKKPYARISNRLRDQLVRSRPNLQKRINYIY